MASILLKRYALKSYITFYVSFQFMNERYLTLSHTKINKIGQI